MTEREELKQAIIKAVDPLGEGEVAYKPEGVAIAVLDAIESLTPQWQRFDPNDSDTWPGRGFIPYLWTHDGNEVDLSLWNGAPYGGWKDVTHWMSVQTPLPPEEKK